MYAEMTVQHKSFIKRFSHTSRFNIAIELLKPSTNDTILDYGTGDGHMVKRVRDANQQCRIVGYEPVAEMYDELQKTLSGSIENEEVEIFNDLSGESDEFNKICCLEVLEHLTEEQQRKEIESMKRLLTNDGQLVISVPIEIGLSSLLKNVARLLLRQPHENATLRNILLSVAGLKIDRGHGPFISNHIGFYYQDLERILLSSGMTMIEKVYSPFPFAKGVVNSQVFYVMKKS